MESLMLASGLMQPGSLIIIFAILFTASYFTYKCNPQVTSIPPLKLVGGYLGIIIVAALLAALMSNMSQQQAIEIHHIPPDQYWNQRIDLFVVTFICLTFFAIFGAALVGIPTIFYFARRTSITAPKVLVISFLISIAMALIFSSILQSTSTKFITIAVSIAIIHFAFSLGFCIGSRLPWRLNVPQKT